MNIMDKPTLQDVKEYFKNAKEVRCIFNKEVADISNWHEYFDNKDNDYWVQNPNDSKNQIELYDHGKYAEIISYKEPLYQLTAKELRYGAENPQWLKDTFKEVFETELEVNKWYRRIDGSIDRLMNYQLGSCNCYGFNTNKVYSNTYMMDSGNDWKQATEKEVEEALKNHFEKINGIKFNNYKFSSEHNRLLGWDGSIRHTLFDDGIWAETIPTYTIPEAEEKFNIKIKAV